MFNSPCQLKSLPLRGIFTGEVNLRLSKSRQRYGRWTCFSLWQQGPNTHGRETWIKCVAPVTSVTMPSWITRSSGGTGPFNYSTLTLHKSDCCHSDLVYHFFYFTWALFISEPSTYPEAHVSCSYRIVPIIMECHLSLYDMICHVIINIKFHLRVSALSMSLQTVMISIVLKLRK